MNLPAGQQQPYQLKIFRDENMNFGRFAAPRYSDCLIAVFNEQIFFRVGYQPLQDILENVIIAPKAEFVINAVPIPEMNR